MSDFVGRHQEHVNSHPDADARRGRRRGTPLPHAEQTRRVSEQRQEDRNQGVESSRKVVMIGGYLIELSQIPLPTASDAVDMCVAEIIADPAGPLRGPDPANPHLPPDPLFGVKVDRFPVKGYRGQSLRKARQLLDRFGSEAELPFMPPLGDE